MPSWESEVAESKKEFLGFGAADWFWLAVALSFLLAICFGTDFDWVFGLRNK